MARFLLYPHLKAAFLSRKIVRMLCLMGLVVFSLAVESVSAATASTLEEGDNIRDTDLAHRNGPYKLDTLDRRPYPFGSFAIFVDNGGVGHVQSFCLDSSEYPRHGARLKDGIIVDWTKRTSYLIRGKGWTQLSLEGAKDLWGEPKKHLVDDHPFYTFDAHSTWNGEENLYHLDLAFAKDGLIMGYRVRGFGIRNLQWVTNNPSLDWIEHVEHVRRGNAYGG
jgi:hypothetical protein